MNIINQDILEIKYGMLVHQVNTLGVMGAGLAKKIKDLYPKMYESYVEDCFNKKRGLGDVMFWVPAENNDICIANLFGQSTIGYKGNHTDYDAWDEALEHIEYVLKNGFTKGYPLYFPYKIGCGLAGGDWNIISDKINKTFPEAIICKI